MVKLFLTAFGLFVISTFAEETEKAAPLQPGTKVPTFSLPTLNGERISL